LAALAAILKALRQAVARDLGALDSLGANNFFLFVALLVAGALNSGVPPKSAEPFFVVLGFLLLFPLSADPLTKIPATRRALWPLTGRQRIGLRLASLAFSPVVWVAVLILLRAAKPGMALAFLALSIGVQGAVVLTQRVTTRAPQVNLLRHIPRFPGRLGGLVRKDLREMLSVLDVYVAVALSVGGAAYRMFAAHPDPAAFGILSLLVALALSTYAQSLFGLELGSGMTRYRLLPLPGWEILLAKDAAFLGILLVFVLPLQPAAGLTFGLVALAIGHHTSVSQHLAHQRWRFTGGRVFACALQVVGGMALGFAEIQHGVAVLAAVIIIWGLSVWWYGSHVTRI
jgi:hypothetical protein